MVFPFSSKDGEAAPHPVPRIAIAIGWELPSQIFWIHWGTPQHQTKKPHLLTPYASLFIKMATALFKSIKKWNLKRSNIISLENICVKKASSFFVWAKPHLYHILSISNKLLKYLATREKEDILWFFSPNFTLVFLCLKHSTHVQQMIMKPQVFISIQNGFIFPPFPLNSYLTRVLTPRTKGACLRFYAPPTNCDRTSEKKTKPKNSPMPLWVW